MPGTQARLIVKGCKFHIRYVYRYTGWYRSAYHCTSETPFRLDTVDPNMFSVQQTEDGFICTLLESRNILVGTRGFYRNRLSISNGKCELYFLHLEGTNIRRTSIE